MAPSGTCVKGCPRFVAHYRCATHQVTLLAPVSRPQPPPFAEQLRALLDETGVSQRELARRLADQDGGKPESKRRWLVKVLDGSVEEPSAQSVAAIERALRRKGAFTLPPPEQRLSRDSRLEALEEEARERTAAIAALLRAVTVLAQQVEAMGGMVPEETQRELARAATRMRRGARRR